MLKVLRNRLNQANKAVKNQTPTGPQTMRTTL